MSKPRRFGPPKPPSQPSGTSTGMSRTLALASGHNPAQVVPSARTTVPGPMPSFDIRPRTDVEQYWAARALKAESFISARMAHDGEIQTLRTSEETKRTRELSILRREHDARNTKLERLVVCLLPIAHPRTMDLDDLTFCISKLILLGCLFALSLFLIYLLSHSIRHPHQHKKSASSHFTIPILSPFTSVVEHETSVVGTKSIMFLFLILVIAGYFAFRKWIVLRT